MEGSLELPATTLQIAWSSAGLVVTALLSYRPKVWKYGNIIAVNYALLVHLGSSVQDDQMLLKIWCFDCNSQIMESKAKSRFHAPNSFESLSWSALGHEKFNMWIPKKPKVTSGLLLAGLSPGHSILILIDWHWCMFYRLKLITMTLSTRLPGDCWLLQSLDLKSQLVRHRLWYVSIHLNLSLSVLSCHALYNAPNQFASRMAFQLEHSAHAKLLEDILCS